MAFVKTFERNTTTEVDANGKVLNEYITEKENIVSYEQNTEPDFIKLYTKMWCDFNQIPTGICRDLFLELVTHMTYCNSNDLEHSQIVYLIGSLKKSIILKLNIGECYYHKLLKNLIQCKAIKKISRGEYQINPEYAGKGEWKYNPRLNRGGVEDLIATFKMSATDGCHVETNIVWADDGSDAPLDNLYRENLGKNSVLKETVIEQTDTH